LVVSTSWKIMEFVNGKDDIPYMKWKIKNVWNHQPVGIQRSKDDPKTSGPHLFWSLAARDFLVDAGVRVPCSIRWNNPSCSWFPASFLKNHAQEPIDLRWCEPIFHDCRLPRENPHNHLADLRASRLNRCETERRRWYASLETWWEVTRERRNTEMWRVFCLCRLLMVTEISPSKCLICLGSIDHSEKLVSWHLFEDLDFSIFLNNLPDEPPKPHLPPSRS